MLKRLLAVVFTACMVVLLAAAAGCGGKGQKSVPQAQETIKIGGIFDITGATGDVGSPYADGARACVDFL
ncbi:MAG: ABC transporter substrate-binding protein, partial [Desulfotomaculales bacterium]